MSVCRVNSAPVYFLAKLHLCVSTLLTFPKVKTCAEPTKILPNTLVLQHQAEPGRMMAGLNMSSTQLIKHATAHLCVYVDERVDEFHCHVAAFLSG